MSSSPPRSPKVGGWCDDHTDTGSANPLRSGRINQRRLSAPTTGLSAATHETTTHIAHGEYTGNNSTIVKEIQQHQRYDVDAGRHTSPDENLEPQHQQQHHGHWRNRAGSKTRKEQQQVEEQSSIGQHSPIIHGWMERKHRSDNARGSHVDAEAGDDGGGTLHTPKVMTATQERKEKKKYAPLFKKAFLKIKQNKYHDTISDIKPSTQNHTESCTDHTNVSNNEVTVIQPLSEDFLNSSASENESDSDSCAESKHNYMSQSLNAFPPKATSAWDLCNSYSGNIGKSDQDPDSNSIKSTEPEQKPHKRRRSFAETLHIGSKRKDKSTVKNIQHNALRIVGQEPDVQIHHSPQSSKVLNAHSSPRHGQSPRSPKVHHTPPVVHERCSPIKSSPDVHRRRNDSQSSGGWVAPESELRLSPLSLSASSLNSSLQDVSDMTHTASVHGKSSKTTNKNEELIGTPRRCFEPSKDEHPSNNIEQMKDSSRVGRKLSKKKGRRKSKAESDLAPAVLVDSLVKGELNENETDTHHGQKHKKAGFLKKYFGHEKKASTTMNDNDIAAKAAHKWKTKTKTRQSSNSQQQNGVIGDSAIQCLDNVIRDMDASDNESDSADKKCTRGEGNTPCNCIQCLRLEAELEAERQRHQDELALKLDRERQKAELKLQDGMKEIHQQMDNQKSQYEQRLVELQQQLNSYKDNTKFDKQKSQTVIQKLEDEKRKLESEVQSVRQHLEAQADAEAEKLKVERKPLGLLNIVKKQMEEMGDSSPRRTPRVLRDTRRTPLTVSRTPKKDLYMRALLLREANRISQQLNKNTVFVVDDVERDGGEVESLIKVTNTALHVSTYWTIEKFEARLKEMRELFQSCRGSDMTKDGSPATDHVFYNHSDQWQAEERLQSTKPHVVTDLCRDSPVLQLVNRLSMGAGGSPNSSLIASPKSITRLDDSLNTSSDGTLFDANDSQSSNSFTSPALRQSAGGLSLNDVDACAELISIALNKSSECTEESVIDRMLGACQLLKSIVSKLTDAQSHIDPSEMKIACFQLYTQSHLLLQMSHMCTYIYQAQRNAASLLTSLSKLTQDICSQIVLVLKGLKRKLHSILDDESRELATNMRQLCHTLGQLASATDTNSSLLAECSAGVSHDHDDTDDDDNLYAQTAICKELRESFHSGYSSPVC